VLAAFEPLERDALLGRVALGGVAEDEERADRGRLGAKGAQVGDLPRTADPAAITSLTIATRFPRTRSRSAPGRRYSTGNRPSSLEAIRSA
jgi:hypothetical protein